MVHHRNLPSASVGNQLAVCDFRCFLCIAKVLFVLGYSCPYTFFRLSFVSFVPVGREPCSAFNRLKIEFPLQAPL